MRGTILEASNAVMQGVKITVIDINHGASQSTTTNEAGQFSFSNVIVGDYRVTAEATASRGPQRKI